MKEVVKLKSLEEIIRQKPVFLNDWSHKVDVVGDFNDIYMDHKEYFAEESPYPNVQVWLEDKRKMDQALKDYEDIDILFASYSAANYSGDAWVLFESKGRLYEVNGSHCSCYGLEGQWDEEDVLLEELENRLLNGSFGEDNWSENNFKQELCKFLGVEYKSNLE